MGKLIDNSLLETVERDEVSAVAQLVELGRDQGFVTFDDILEFFPEAEDDVDLLEQAFSALISAGIEYIEDEDEIPNDQDEESGVKPGKPDGNGHKIQTEEDQLANIDSSDLVGLYLKEAASIPLLTAEEERELAMTIEKGREAREELGDGKVSSKRRRELVQQIEDGREALEHLLTANSRLVVSIAKKYVRRGVPFLDLIQEGNVGLMRAAKKFDYRRGYKFSTYATWWIRQAVTRSIANHSRTIRIPAHMGDKMSKLRRMQNQLKQDLGREPTKEELAEALDLTPQKVEYILKVSRQPLSLEMPINFEGDSYLGDFIEDSEAPNPEETATDTLFREQLMSTLEERLPAREARVLKMRYGIPDGESHTLREVGNKIGVTRERVRQLEAQALRRLRHASVHPKLRDYLR